MRHKVRDFKLARKTPKIICWLRPGVLILNFEHHFNPIKPQPHKVVKHLQTIRWLLSAA